MPYRFAIDKRTPFHKGQTKHKDKFTDISFKMVQMAVSDGSTLDDLLTELGPQMAADIQDAMATKKISNTKPHSMPAHGVKSIYK